MRRESLPPMKEVYQALEDAAVDLYGFGVVCQGGSPIAADPEVLDTLLLGLENVWFNEDSKGVLSHLDFREDFFRVLWEKSYGKRPSVRIGSDVPLGHEEMAFYQLPQLTRAALYLRTKKKFTYPTISRVLGVPEPLLESEVEKAREFLLGRRVKELEWAEEDF
jgi:hypothetical protein